MLMFLGVADMTHYSEHDEVDKEKNGENMIKRVDAGPWGQRRTGPADSNDFLHLATLCPLLQISQPHESEHGDATSRREDLWPLMRANVIKVVSASAARFPLIHVMVRRTLNHEVKLWLFVEVCTRKVKIKIV